MDRVKLRELILQAGNQTHTVHWGIFTCPEKNNFPETFYRGGLILDGSIPPFLSEIEFEYFEGRAVDTTVQTIDPTPIHSLKPLTLEEAVLLLSKFAEIEALSGYDRMLRNSLLHLLEKEN